MKWLVAPECREEEQAVGYLKDMLAAYDTSRLEWFRIDLGRGRYAGAYGRCWYPTRARKGYRISVQVPGPFPYDHQRFVRPLYRQPDGSWPPVPDGCRKAGWKSDPKSGKEWFQLTTRYTMDTRAIAIVHIGAHEVFHFLRKSRQIGGRNGENEADQWALEQEQHFRLLLTLDTK